MIDIDMKKWLKSHFNNRIQYNEPMAEHTSFRVGGPADVFVMPNSIEELEILVRSARERDIPLTIIGGGTNLLVRDQGISGMVIALAPHFSTINIIRKNQHQAHVSALTGTRTNTLCRFALKHGWEGLNFAMGIPGTVGGGITMNAGSESGCMADVLTSLKVMSPLGEIEKIEKKNLTFSYRHFGLKNHRFNEIRKPLILLEGCFSLKPLDKARLNRQAEEILCQRKKKQPLSVPSAGSFFKNPEHRKPAGALIEQAGLKGKRVGDAEVSPLHGNFIVNIGRATARDILQLMVLVQETVSKKFDIDLEPEVIIIGK